MSLLVLTAGVSAYTSMSGFTDETYEGNFSDNSSQPTVMDHERGYIHVVNIDKTQQTPRWKAYVGSITGELALGDGEYSIFNWDLDVVTGEIYATRFNGSAPSSDWPQGTSSHGLPRWNKMECATSEQLANETTNLNHNYALDVDALNRTFNNSYNFLDFSVVSRNINTTDCYGTFLNYNGTNDNSVTGEEGWQQVVLTDGSDGVTGDLMYSSLLKNQGLGFNTQTYDYQILLPENGDMSSQDIASEPYYFYIELLGDVN